ncbi:MAG: selenoprotein B, partial [Alphaproteobacteria bacterium]
MSGLAHILESEGIATVAIALIRKHAEDMKPPRALAVPFELGRPLGAPNEPDFQRRVLRTLLELLAKESGPVLEDFPDEPPGAASDMEGWACPVNFAAPVDDLSDEDLIRQALLQEISLLKPWYEESKQTRGGRTNFGISGKTPEEIAAYIAHMVTAREDTE